MRGSAALCALQGAAGCCRQAREIANRASPCDAPAAPACTRVPVLALSSAHGIEGVNVDAPWSGVPLLRGTTWPLPGVTQNAAGRLRAANEGTRRTRILSCCTYAPPEAHARLRCLPFWAVRPPTLTVLAAAGDIKQPFSYMLRQDGTGTPVLSLDAALIRRCYADGELTGVWAEHNTSGWSATAAGGAGIWGTRPARQLRSYTAQAVLHRVLGGRACGEPDGGQQRRCTPAAPEPEGKRRSSPPGRRHWDRKSEAASWAAVGGA